MQDPGGFILVTLRRLTATLWILAALIASDGARPDRAAALQAGLRSGAEGDTLTVSAEGAQLPKYTVRRTGPRELTVTFAPAPGEKAPAAPAIGGSGLVAGVRAVPGGFKILLKTPAFGYVNFPVSGKPQMQVQIFPDAVGARWADPKKDEPKPEAVKKEIPKPEAKPAEAKQAAEPKPDSKVDPRAEAAAKRKEEAERRKAEAEQKKAEAAQKKAEAEAQKKAEAEAKKAEAARRKEEEAEAKRQKELAARQPKAGEAAPPAVPAAPATPAAPAQAAPAPAPSPSVKPEGAQPYFSPPYTFRAPVNKTVLGAPGSTGAPGTTLPALSGPAPAPAPEKQKGGKVPPGVVEKPIVQEHSAGPASTPGPAPEAAPAPAPLPVPPVAPAVSSVPPLDIQPAKGKADVRFRADRRGPEDPRPPEILSGVPAKAAAPGQLATAPGRAWELRQPVQKVLPPMGEANATQPPAADGLNAPEPAPPPPSVPAEAAAIANGTAPLPGTEAANASAGTANASAANASAANASAANASAADKKDAAPAPKEGGKDKEQVGPLTEQQVKDKILTAQSNMVGGNWQAASKALEEVLREPALKGDSREETLYSLADTYMQQYKDSLAANFDRISGAQHAAMNANQKSTRVPRALFNLGLLNLKVNNMAEAKAYFNIINRKYPQDQNAALIPYYLGEHYRAKGELQKAADQYNTLIQKHPDSRPVKEAAYTLAQILRKLGQFDKAFQIVDYIDKRWPLFYMENPAFLKLAAEVEEKVGKLAQAKDHYWTYYNLSPDAEFADITLVRIGDIYLRQNKKNAAREVYQKAVHDFPDREGGQIARMRLAEEGIHDDPTMSEMVSVFNRPEALKPNETYELIMTKYPASPLAPLAMIKLGMWQFHTKAYLDALNTAQSFLEKYPKSGLVGKAGELGFNAFLQALPTMVQEGHFQKIMQLFDGASFVKENQEKIGDEARMAIAIAAWKRGDPERALKLAGKFLGKQQVPKYSEMALDMAMNIFLERKEWSRISELAQRSSKAWKLSPRQQTQFEYARAMALENMGDAEKSMPLWTKIASDTGADPATRAYATYLLAKAAARKQDMHRLFALAQDALGQLLATGGDKDKIKDCLLMTITATERSGRYAEAAKWAREFDRIIPDSDPDWAPTRLRLADIYQKGGMQKEYRELLQGIVQKKPNTVYSRMAQQALEGSALDQRLQNYLTKGGG